MGGKEAQTTQISLTLAQNCVLSSTLPLFCSLQSLYSPFFLRLCPKTLSTPPGTGASTWGVCRLSPWSRFFHAYVGTSLSYFDTLMPASQKSFSGAHKTHLRTQKKLLATGNKRRKKKKTIAVCIHLLYSIVRKREREREGELDEKTKLARTNGERERENNFLRGVQKFFLNCERRRSWRFLLRGS